MYHFTFQWVCNKILSLWLGWWYIQPYLGCSTCFLPFVPSRIGNSTVTHVPWPQKTQISFHNNNNNYHNGLCISGVFIIKSNCQITNTKGYSSSFSHTPTLCHSGISCYLINSLSKFHSSFKSSIVFPHCEFVPSQFT